MPVIDIVVPRHLHQKLKTLAELDQETNGVFFYTPASVRGHTLWQVHSFLLTGRGDHEHVTTHPSYVRVANLMLNHLCRQSPRTDWGFVKAHTHCRGTGRQLGEGWFHQFSQQDMDSVRGELSDNPDYTLMMYSPTHHLAAGHPRNRYNVVVVDSTPEHRRNSMNLERLATRLRRQHGIPEIRWKASVHLRRR
ncbi:MAG: hypothetical protein Q8R15_01700 [Candidatus Micrarchaeota archaeon]|nr:hypothetical protein [Candidatus Micrarchaeota archaeon]